MPTQLFEEPSSSFFTEAGTPAAMCPGGTCLPSWRTAPAASIEPAPSRLRCSIVAPIPTTAPVSTTQPSSRAECPTLAWLSITVGRPSAQWITTLSCTLAPSQTLMAASSAQHSAEPDAGSGFDLDVSDED